MGWTDTELSRPRYPFEPPPWYPVNLFGLPVFLKTGLSVRNPKSEEVSFEITISLYRCASVGDHLGSMDFQEIKCPAKCRVKHILGPYSIKGTVSVTSGFQ